MQKWDGHPVVESDHIKMLLWYSN